MTSVSLLLSLLLGVADVRGGSEFRICAFNLHHFGESKSNKNEIMITLARIITRCDVCLLQEVRDRKGTAVSKLLQTIRRYDTRNQYDLLASERLGRKGSYQEQYVFVYRTNTVKVTDRYQYPDNMPGDEDAFSREPFVVRFKAPKTSIQEFVLIPQHTTPTNATKELDALYDVLQNVRRMWRTENVMLLGDFNADCGYLAKKNRDKVRLITDRSLHWLIGEDSDTTVKHSTSCSYDRIVIHGEKFNGAVVPSSAQPFNFQQEYRLTEEQALNVSDHYPVEVLLKVSSSRSFNGVTSFTSSFTAFQCFCLIICHLLS
ncbi:deoxyribonuclease-1-like [Xiphophorus maculatus]|uniref:Deoxyribonuclease n=1 Tax=Xiphophorus maculatus TaxID=8083 RepID=M3ZRI0_XIPMA|nr:deoxyribonuclease-1-like [Xiphophorus maculatus]XP_023198798.1 deoxyribonuclease-1-like [Xiphophorus maculatus]